MCRAQDWEAFTRQVPALTANEWIAGCYGLAPNTNSVRVPD
jgi:hypothetical protein